MEDVFDIANLRISVNKGKNTLKKDRKSSEPVDGNFGKINYKRFFAS